ncbi:hypothetical protein LEN26_003650, partial [Aphanomyces euteiches]
QPAWINRSLKVEEGDIINVRSVPKLPTQPKNIADLAKAHHAMTKNAVAKANADAARHKAKVSQLTVELSTLKTKITQIEASTAAASEANEEMIKSLETEREELKSQVQKINAAWTKEKSEHDVVIKTLRGQVSSLEESTRALTFDLDKNQQEKADLTDQLSALNGKLNFANSYVNDLEAVLRKTEAASAANERMMRRLEDEREDLQAQVEIPPSSFLKINNATDMAAMHTEKTTELRDQIKTLTAQLESERSQRIELQAQSAKLKENLADVKSTLKSTIDNLADVKSTMKCTIANLSARLKQAKNKASTAKKALITHQNVSRHIESGLQEKVAKLEEKAATNETRLNAQITTLEVELKGVEDQLEHVQKEEEERFAMGIADAEAARIRTLQQEEELMRLKPLSTELRLLRVKIFKCALDRVRLTSLFGLAVEVRTVVKVGDITRHTRPRRITSPLLSLFGSAEYTFQEDDIAFPLREGDMYSKSLEVLVYCEDGDELIGSLVLPLINFESNGRAKEYNLEMSPGFQNIGNHGEITLKLELWKKS